MYPFVTISRQAGAGGRKFVQALLTRLEALPEKPLFQGWQSFDKELCEKVAQDPAIKVSFQALVTEKFRNDLEDDLSQIIADESPQLKVHRKIFSIIDGLAAVGKAVIVGRGGACLTRNHPLGIHIRLVASRKSCVERIMEQMGTGRREAERWIVEQDNARAKLIRSYFDKNIDDPLLYDAIFNSDAAPFDMMASAVISMIEYKAAASKKAELESSAG
ncbi:MAG: hypothetical protein A3G41_08470 [Elusimicrobia bacterium RIFCSPLOWO2_12_FULL_59_9]|nr:MAG: hypothetical protein A3G41_08470 [Elusimicrobia bacterium RIFCSPLOWO2_12_FULL_59_9]